MDDIPQSNLDDLDNFERMRLLRFVCSFAWADLDIADSERDYVSQLMKKLGLDQEEQDEVNGWLEVPPAPEDVDPTEIPREHRQVFLKTILELVVADGIVDPAEVESFTLFEQLLR